MNISAPKLFSSFPEASNLRIGGSLLPAHELAPQRSATQMLAPSRSISTALVDPHMRPSGSLNQLSMVRYGSGCEFGAWASTSPAENTAVVTVNRSRVDMALLSTGHLTSVR